MATIKVACPKCGQKVSGDETFYGTVVECPICSADIRFPGERRQEGPREPIRPVPPDPGPHDSLPRPVPPSEQAPVLPSKSSIDEEAVPKTSRDPDPPGPGDADDDDEPHLPPSPLFGAISIVSAVLSVVICVFGGVIFAPLAIIFGHTALAKARVSPVQPAPGHTLGAIGLMIGYVSLILTILFLVAAVVFNLDDTLRGWLEKKAG